MTQPQWGRRRPKSKAEQEAAAKHQARVDRARGKVLVDVLVVTDPEEE